MKPNPLPMKISKLLMSTTKLRLAIQAHKNRACVQSGRNALANRPFDFA